MGDAAIDDGDCNWYATDVGPCPKVFIFIFLSLRLLYPLIARADLLLYRYRSPPPLATTHHPILYDIVMGRCSLRSANLCWDVLKFLIGAAIDRMMVGTLVGSDFPISPFAKQTRWNSILWIVLRLVCGFLLLPLCWRLLPLRQTDGLAWDGFYGASKRIGPLGIPSQLSFRMARSVSLTWKYFSLLGLNW